MPLWVTITAIILVCLGVIVLLVRNGVRQREKTMTEEKYAALMFLGILSCICWFAYMIGSAESAKPKTLKCLAILGTFTGSPVLIWAYSTVILG